MMNVVYFCGAGFSAPAGLPVISNFIFMARDQYFKRPDEYQYFKRVFQYIDGLSKAKNFTAIDLFNVEEVFSIADTHQLLGKGMKKDLQVFIKDVIHFYTPTFEKHGGGMILKSNSFDILFGANPISRQYVGFVAGLLLADFETKVERIEIEILEYEDLKVKQASNTETSYKVITLNYDTILEDAVHFLNTNFDGDLELPLAKLHGSVDGEIVPPTWNKKLNRGTEEAWKNAAQWISEANEIRILGYSLPPTDIHIKHLFSTALAESENLQKIDVFCLDSDGIVEDRYKRMFNFPMYSFSNTDISHLLRFPGGGYSHSPFKLSTGDLEQSYQNFLNY